jgi:peptidoglycan/LPS O-acetylase OafA/YrhL
VKFKGINLFSEIEAIPPILNQKQYPSLNGLRAISIIMVVIYHYMFAYTHKSQSLNFIGPLGVNIFFVISGFLITTLCLKEKILTNALSLKKFYLRRAFRILPVAFLYILVIAVLNYAFNLHMAATSFIAACLLLVNLSYFQKFQLDWYLAHYWSLSVEEQFYLLFPVLIKKRFNLFVVILLVICLPLPFIFYLQRYIPFLNNVIITCLLQYLVKFQGIAVGCLFSVLLFKGYLNFGKLKPWITLVSIIMIFFTGYDVAVNARASLLNLITSILTGFIIINNISPQQNILYRILNLKWLNWIGILSYSIYIWQQLFLSNDPRFPLSKYPLNLVFVIVVPCLSYFFYEKYFLSLKARFAKIRTVNKNG